MSNPVLIIDDEKLYLEPLTDLLALERINYDYCDNGYEGWSLVKSNAYKVVILDMKVSFGEEWKQMIGYKPAPGIFILQKIKEVKPELPVICYTVLRDKEVVQKIMDLGARHIPKKGSDSNDYLIEEIKKYL